MQQLQLHLSCPLHRHISHLLHHALRHSQNKISTARGCSSSVIALAISAALLAIDASSHSRGQLRKIAMQLPPLLVCLSASRLEGSGGLQLPFRSAGSFFLLRPMRSWALQMIWPQLLLRSCAWRGLCSDLCCKSCNALIQM